MIMGRHGDNCAVASASRRLAASIRSLASTGEIGSRKNGLLKRSYGVVCFHAYIRARSARYRKRNLRSVLRACSRLDQVGVSTLETLQGHRRIIRIDDLQLPAALAAAPSFLASSMAFLLSLCCQ